MEKVKMTLSFTLASSWVLSAAGRGDLCECCAYAGEMYLDFTPLKKTDGDWIVVTDDYDFHLQICGAGLSGNAANCGHGAGPISACQVDNKDDTGKYGLGIVSGSPDSFKFVDSNDFWGGIRLEYQVDKSDDTLCHGATRRVAEILFKCDPNGGGVGAPVFDTETNDCTYKFIWSTSFACWDNAKQFGAVPATPSVINCQYADETSRKSFDLSGLGSPTVNVMTTGITNGESYEYHINVCRYLAPRPGDEAWGDACAGNVGVCQTKVGDAGFSKNLGAPASPTWDSDLNKLVIEYEAGSVGSHGPKRTRIVFVCAPENGRGTPSFQDEIRGSDKSGTTYLFEWRTAYACQRDEVLGTDCRVKDDVRDDVWYDFAPLRDAGIIEYTRNGETVADSYAIGLCGRQADCAGAVCKKRVEDQGWSMIGNLGGQPTFVGGAIKMEFNSDEKCTKRTENDPNQFLKKSTVIQLECEVGGADARGNVTAETIATKMLHFLNDDGCTAEFSLQTAHACPPPADFSCTFTAHGKPFDLTGLNRGAGAAAPWDVFQVDEDGVNKYQYFLSLCSPLAIETLPRVCSNSFMCQKEVVTGQAWPMASKMTQMDLDADVVLGGDGASTGTKITLSYTDGQKCGSTGTGRTVKVVLTCDPNVPYESGPTFVHEEGCNYLFEWTTPVACPLGVSAGNAAVTSSCGVQNAGFFIDLEAITPASYVVEIPVDDGGGTVSVGICKEPDGASCGGLEPAACLAPSGGGLPQVIGESSRDRIIEPLVGGGAKITYRNGAPCPEGADGTYSTIINVVCSADRTAGDLKFESFSQCTYVFRLATSKACAPQGIVCEYLSQDNKHSYDLSLLVKDGQEDYEIEGNNGERFSLNVCRGLSGSACASRALPNVGVCRIDPSGSASSLGTRAGPSWEANDNGGQLVLDYGQGDGGESAKIEFKCLATSAAEEGPRFLHKEGTKFVFGWATYAACPLQYIEGADNECKIAGMDLSGLKGERRITAGEFVYTIQVCGGNREFMTCGEGPGSTKSLACQKSTKTGKSYSLGGNGPKGAASANQKVLIYEYKGVPRLWYRGGDVCHSSGGREGFGRSAVVEFKCDPYAGDGNPKFVAEVGQCIYLFSWHTAHVCRNEIASTCSLSGSDGKQYDLSVLSNHYSNWEVKTESNQRIEFNVCRTLVKQTTRKDVSCELTAGACSYSPADLDTKGISLGLPPTPSLINFDGTDKAVLEFSVPDPECTPGTQRTRVVFECPQDVHGAILGQLGAPRFTSQDSCATQITWETSAACELGISRGDNCKVTNSVGQQFDFSSLAGKQKVYKTSTADGTAYSIALCGTLPTADKKCANQAACQVTKHGKFGMGNELVAPPLNPGLSMDGDKIKLRYFGGTPCHDNQFRRSTHIEFMCVDTAEEPVLKFVQEFDNCEYFFQLETKLACAGTANVPTKGDSDQTSVIDVEPCAYTDTDTGEKYDLSALKRSDGEVSHIASDSEEISKYKYYINVCRSLAWGATPLANHGCPRSAAVCQVEQGSDGLPDIARNLGTPDEGAGSMFSVKGGSLVLQYQGGDSQNCGGPRSSIIEFKCSPEASSNSIPEFVGEKNLCEYSFIWYTKSACAIGTNKSGNTGDVLADPSICPEGIRDYDTKLVSESRGVLSWATSLFNNNGDNGRSFKVKTCGEAGSCGHGGICLVTNDGETSLGEFRSAPRTDEDGHMVLDYVHGASCPKDSDNQQPDAVASAQITFKCGPSEDTEPEFESFHDVNNECLYKFVWHSKFACAEPKLSCVVEGTHGQIDLKRLTKTEYHGSNYIVKGTNAIVMNVCAELLKKDKSYQDEKLAEACYGSAICVDDQPFGMISQLYEPSINEEGFIELWYPRNSPCDFMCDGKCGATIIFVCDSDFASGPFVSSESSTCSKVIKFPTSLVCAESTGLDNGEQEVSNGDVDWWSSTGSNCHVQSTISGAYFNLMELKAQETDVTITSGDGKSIRLGVCRSLKQPCGGQLDDVAACYDDQPQGNLGASELVYTDDSADGELYIKYEFSQSNCPDTKGFTKIIFRCSSSVEVGEPEYDEAASMPPCKQLYTWKTKHACKSKPKLLSCYVRDENTGEQFDLAPLKRLGSESNWVVETPSDKDYQYKYELNVCADLINSAAENCAGAAVCQHDVENPSIHYNLGSTPVLYVDDGILKLSIRNGQKCGSNNQHRTTLVTFVCEKNVGAGSPVYMGEDPQCQYNIEWRSSYGCPEHTEVLEDEPCKIDDLNDRGQDFVLDLSSIHAHGITANDASGKSAYKFQLCGSKLPKSWKNKCPRGCACYNDAVLACGGKLDDSLSSMNIRRYIYSDGKQKCPGDPNSKASVSIELTCDDLSYKNSLPVLTNYDRSTCRHELTWRTSLACPLVELNCVYYDPKVGKTFDLRRLNHNGRFSGDIELDTPSSDKVFINLCRSVKKPECFRSGMCVVRNGESYAVGNVPSGFSLLDEDKSTLLMSKEVDGKNVIVMKFAGGECPDSDSGKGTSAEIRFECDVFDRLQSTPAVTASTSCAYVVTWKTCLACPGDDPCNGAAGPEPTLAEPGYEAAKTTRPSSERSPSSHGKRKRSGGRGITVAIIIIFLLGAAAMLFIHPKLRVLVTGLIDRSGGRSSTVEYSSLSMGYNANLIEDDDDDDDDDDDNDDSGGGFEETAYSSATKPEQRLSSTGGFTIQDDDDLIDMA